jgi:endonuclease/exonuclease/phosphatase family metal-dependent hydrolase
MPQIRVASVNGEWMNDWFGPDAQAPAFRASYQRDGVQVDVNATATRLAALIRAIDADVVALQEGPSRPGELQLFVNQYLAQGGQPIYQSLLGDAGGAQKLGLLWKASVQARLVPSNEVQTVIDPWTADVDGDAFVEPYAFTRNPLVARLDVGPRRLDMIVMHTKSSYVNQGQALWMNPATRQEYVVAALKARRRNATECMRVRDYLDARLAADPGANIIVCGDLNDGPGRDYFERNYLAHNTIDVLIGSSFAPETMFYHCQHDAPAAERYTAVFDDFVEAVPNRRLLLDHLLASPGLRAGGLRRVAGSGRVCHQEYEAQLANGGARRDERPCDHRPVSVELRW